MIRLHKLRRILVLRIRDGAVRGELRHHRIHVDRRGGEATGIVGLILIQLTDLRGIERRRLRELSGVGEQHAGDGRLREGVRSGIRRDTGRDRIAEILHAGWYTGDRRSAVSVERLPAVLEILHAALQRAHDADLGLVGRTDSLVVLGARVRQQRMPHVHDALWSAQRRKVYRCHLRHRVLLLLLQRFTGDRERAVVAVPRRGSRLVRVGRRVVLPVQRGYRRLRRESKRQVRGYRRPAVVPALVTRTVDEHPFVIRLNGIIFYTRIRFTWKLLRGIILRLHRIVVRGAVHASADRPHTAKCGTWLLLLRVYYRCIFGRVWFV